MKRKSIHALERIINGRVEYDVPLSGYTSIRIGGPAWAVAHPGDEKELADVMAFCREQDIPFVIIGNGTNLLVLDGGIEALVIRVAEGLDNIRVIKDKSGNYEIEAGAGASVRRVLGSAVANGLSGMEYMVGIPGTIGGAIATNAGAAGNSIAKVITKIRLVNSKRDRWEMDAGDLSFSYRKTLLPPESAISGSFFGLIAQDSGDIRRKMRGFMQKRMMTQPLTHPSAGCMFKNPEGDFAGRLIEEAGMKGCRYGDAQISDLHANFIINRGRACADDVLRLLKEARKRVKALSGVDLEPEIQIIGIPK